MPAPYPSPLYSHRSATSGALGIPVDITNARNSSAPPVIICSFTAGPPTFNIEGSHDNVTWFAFLTAANSAQAKDLIVTVRFWRTNVTNFNGATFTSVIGPSLDAMGELVSMNYVQTSTTNINL